MTAQPAPDPSPAEPTSLADQLCAALGSLQDFIAGSSDPGASQAAADLATVVASIAQLVAAPDRLEVTAEHRSAAVALVTSYLDGDRDHALLLDLLGAYDLRGLGDPAFRLAIVAALTQLTADALVAAAVVWVGESDAELTDETLTPACLALLQRIALATDRTGAD